MKLDAGDKSSSLVSRISVSLPPELLAELGVRPSHDVALDRQPGVAEIVDMTLLASFQLEQTGDRVVITDADGSVYEGRIQNTQNLS